MKNPRLFIPFALLFPILMVSKSAYAQEEMRIWREFVSAVKKGEITAGMVCPLHPSLTEDMVRWLHMIGEQATRAQLTADPEVSRVGNQINYIVPLGESTICFMLAVDGDRWYFRHMENIFIRLDKIDSLPASTFPDVSEERKAWAREETYWSERVRLFELLSKEKGRQAALDSFKDGAGYFLGARAWVPFVSPERAFILYLCWEQANLRGNKLVLERLDDDHASVRFTELIYFELYEHSSHLKQLVSEDDYRSIFETIWRDRAAHAGWNVQFSYKSPEYVLQFTKGK